MTWKTVEEFPEYEINEFGVVRRFVWPNNIRRSPHILKQFKTQGLKRVFGELAKAAKGYWAVSLRSGGRIKVLYVHRLVCAAFNGPAPANKPWVLHRDDDPDHNHSENLYWGDRNENVLDAVANGRLPKKGVPTGRSWRGERQGSGNPMARLTVSQILSIRADGRIARLIAQDYGITCWYVYDILKRRVWNHI